jgi:hypothetical protein
LLDALKKAWDNANYADQEEFVRDYRVDLAEMLEAKRAVNPFTGE